ncbi:MAG: TonB-dependent receptor plug domain-containing protein [Flavobacteriales bacterium]
MMASIQIDAQAHSIRGIVRDRATGEIIVGAVVRNTSGDGQATGIEGQFVVTISGPQDSLMVSMIGYKSRSFSGSEILAMTVVELLISPIEETLNMVVISAGKFEQKLGEVTVSMEVIQPELLHDKNVVVADEALQQTPGVSIVDGEPQIRSGSGYSFGAGSRVQILVDDLPLLSGDAGRPSWGFFPVENLSQIEVIKGASSVLYGSAALSGVINMRTAFPDDTAKTVITLFHGVYSDPQNDSAKYWSATPMRSGLNFLHSQKLGQLDLVIGGSYYGDDGHLGPIPDSVTGAIENKYNPFTVDRYYATNRGRINANLRYRNKKIVGLSYGINTNWRQRQLVYYIYFD